MALAHYRYSCLDQLVSFTLPREATTQRFYQRGLLTSEVQEQDSFTIFQAGGWLLAQQDPARGTTNLLATDLLHSVSHALHDSTLSQTRYMPYGHCPASRAALGFAGERTDPMTRQYLLGSYRAFNPLLMRFHRPDSLSPFLEGGLNAYAYCGNDPVNRHDPSGHSALSDLLRVMRGLLKARPKRPLGLPQHGTWGSKRYSDGLESFRDTKDGRITFMGHGRRKEDGTGRLLLDKAGTIEMSGDEFARHLLKNRQYNLKQERDVRFFLCYGANRGVNGEPSFIERFTAEMSKNKLDLKVKGFHEEVSTPINYEFVGDTNFETITVPKALYKSSTYYTDKAKNRVRKT